MNLKHLFVLLFLTTLKSFSQNYRDKVIHETLNPILDSYKPVSNTDYLKVKELILKLDEDYGYEADLHLKLMNLSYKHNDLDFFKTQLSRLVEKHGFTIAYMTGSESYAEAVLKGDLAVWFKPMYIKNHSIWLEQNFDKQLDLKQLNEARLKDQLLNSYGMKIKEKIQDESVLRQVSDIQNELLFNVLTDVYKIARKYDRFPTGKNFGLIQHDFSMMVQHNFMSADNLERTWILFEPYFKQACLKHDLDYGMYKKYDVYSYVATGFQKYGLITAEDLPWYFFKEKEENPEIPVRNLFFADKFKSEMGWK
ncbi:hypothetical protein [Flavobacterium suncheonense]|uniref:Uncharacterized protein n=1 Tax=Flavobacterium suncheonense GH29-5 = DSM 17707 TaxID=1121899 RepID=A0A0A2MNE8_9FLAO|nr:hypothetical protein [Flavobacterium suncheonense]KGO89810.1 hypothetical protein Q764_06385 [Flavobacterium suncheonense GH29-5 = DSM 17707]